MQIPGHDRRRLLTCALFAPLAACGGGSAASSGAPGSSAPSPSASKWKPLADLAGGPRQECGVAALNGQVFVVGGFSGSRNILTSVEAYDPATDTWRRAASLTMPLHHPNVAAARGKLYVLGALEQMSFTAIGVAFEYDPAGDRWAAVGGMPAGTQRGAAATAAINNRVYVAGGARGGSAVTDFSVYDVVINAWQALPPLPVAAEHVVGVALNGLLYVIGGRSGGTLRNEVQIYDPATNRWAAGRPMPTARGGLMGAAVGNRIHVVGGEGNTAVASGIFPQHEVYDPAQDTWSTLGPMRTPRHGTGAAGIDGTLFVPGGATVQGFGAVGIHEAFRS
jgi:N-acetylneuraminic acid mutarotase